MEMPFDLLLGRKTFEIWSNYWPNHDELWPSVNKATKYVAPNTITSHEWRNSVFLSGDMVEKHRKIKEEPGPDLHVYGSGKRLFAGETIPAAFQVTESQVSPKGVIMVNNERAGNIRTGQL